MFIPIHFSEQDRKKIISFMKEYNFAVIINIKNNLPIATHLPFVIEERGEELIIKTHMAKANEQWSYFNNSTEVLVIFNEPHSYISPSLYEHKQNVPTWNYIAIHAYGIPHIYPKGSETINLLESQFEDFEPAYKTQWNELNKDYKNKLLEGIVAFEIKVTKLEAKFKLSQNKSDLERKNIINTLASADDKTGKDLAKHMKKDNK